MLALVFHGNHDIRLEQRPVPVPGPGEVLLQVTDAGLCQTQINEFMEGPLVINREPNPQTGRALPLIVGHEFGGRVERVGADVNEDFIGEQMAVLPLLGCGHCSWCHSGRENLCDSLAYYGLTGADGGFAEYAVVRAANLLPVARRQLLTFTEPLLVAMHLAAQLERPLRGRRTLILGAGTIGVAAAAVLQDLYAAEVRISEILPQRARRAAAAGFTVLDKTELKQEYDIVVDCAGSNPYSNGGPALIEGLGYLDKQGSLLSVGSYFHPITVEPIRMLIQEQRIFNSFAYDSRDVARLAARLAEIRTDFGTFIEEIPLDEIIEQGYYRGEMDKDGFTRLVVRC